MHSTHLNQAINKKGFITITVAVILGVVLVVGMSLLSYVSNQKRAEKLMTDDIIAVQVAEAGIEKALYCLNATSGDECGGQYGLNYVGEAGIDLGTGYFSTVIVGAGAERTITSAGTTYSGLTKTIQATLTTIPPTDQMSFGFALQAGGGGAYLSNNSRIVGTLYSNGDIDCQSSNAIVDGDAYVSKVNGIINNCRVNYNAYADSILGSRVYGDAYYNINPTGISGTTVSGTKYSGSTTPEPANLPAVDLQFWMDSAEAGGIITGPYYPADNSFLGPIKIEGDLILSNNVDVTITGPVWVQGNIQTGNNVSFTLDSSFASYSTVLLAHDPLNQTSKGKVIINNNTGVYGSGNPTSHLVFISTNLSTAPGSAALSVANNSSGAIFFATAGMLEISNNAGAKSLAAYKIYANQNAIVNYVESELADAEFSNSPSGLWRIKKGDWRQTQ